MTNFEEDIDDLEEQNTSSKEDNKTLVIIMSFALVFIIMTFFVLFSSALKKQEAREMEKIARTESRHSFEDMNFPPKVPVFRIGEKFHFVIIREFEFSGDLHEAEVTIEIPEDIPSRQKVWDVQVSPKPERIEKRQDGTYATILYKKPSGNNIIKIEGNAQVRTYNLQTAEKYNKNIDGILSLEKEDKYLKHEAGIDTRSKFIRNICKNKINTATNDVDTVKNIFDFVFHNMRYDLSKVSEGKKGSIEALASGRGVCEDFVSVFVTLCRIKGIPARAVIGFDLPFTDEIIKNRTGHAWIEVYLDKYGWVTFDPTNDVNDGFRKKLEELEITPYDAMSELIKYRTYLTVDMDQLNVRSKGQGDITTKKVNVTFLKLNQ